MNVIEDVKTAMQGHTTYGMADAIFRTKKYWQQEAEITARAKELLAVVHLSGKEDLEVDNLPYGEQRRLEIARALATDMKLLLLDEPAAGMNPTETEELLEIINYIRKEFKGIKSMLEVIAHSRKVRNLLVQRVPNKPPICHIHFNLFQCPAQGTDTVDMLNQYDFEQHDRVYAGTTVILTVKVTHKFVNPVEVNRRINLTEQMVRWNHLLQTNKFYLIAILNIFRKHVHHPYLLYHTSPRLTRKRSPVGAFFDRLTVVSCDTTVE